jgi:hypothetical protein
MAENFESLIVYVQRNLTLVSLAGRFSEIAFLFNTLV